MQAVRRREEQSTLSSTGQRVGEARSWAADIARRAAMPAASTLGIRSGVQSDADGHHADHQERKSRASGVAIAGCVAR
jgi:hypothetical protein